MNMIFIRNPLARRFLLWVGLAGLAGFGPGQATRAPAAESDAVIWSLGQADGMSIEFAPGASRRVIYTVGENTPSRDFPGRHEGSLGFDAVAPVEKPYTILFDLPKPPSGAYELVLDLIFKSGAPQKIEVMVNDQLGVFPVRLAPKKSGFGEEANMMLLAEQHLVIPIEARWLKAERNRITLVPVGMGSLEYDALALVQRSAPPEAGAGESVRLEPTIFYRTSKGKLMEVCHMVIPFRTRVSSGQARVELGQQTFEASFNSGPYDFGVLTEEIELPALATGTTVNWQVRINNQLLRETQPFRPARQWKVYICPKVHNDVGYTDLQPHVNELDNRNTDTALEIMDRFPFYVFNFETSWLVENYLDCRPPSWRQRFFDRAAEGRAVLNAFYLNLMTGICSGEELYRAMYYTRWFQREHGGNLDFACLTDAPSHSWFLPSLLLDVGIKAFSNGSNQTRAPILHFSDLNENSPFYWEGVNGERIFMWYARSYTQWKRLTGPDFINQAASFEYLQASVPQFLVQFRRDDYAPDAVMIYGAYVDNAAIPRTGEAELIERWNQQYAFPKLVVASDAEYFRYIEKHFGSKLPVYRGDAGAYWEDGVASSSAATKLNRNAHEILPVAETAASLATLYNSRERYPAEDFRGAWKNVLFYDEHTWGAHNSVSQPDREFVKRQWEIKESYATRAHLDARNLLARGFNRLCQNMAVEGDTVFAFNWQNWVRTEPLEVELQQDQYLVDLTKKEPVPLDVLSEQDGWKRVCFLAQDVPPIGYKGYAIRSLQAPETKRIEPTAKETIENSHYRLTVDPKTGGLSSLFDKATGRELADPQAPYKLNQYVYVTGGEGSLILNHAFGTPPAKLEMHAPHAVQIMENTRTPFGHRLVIVTSATNTPQIRSEYRIYDQIKRVDILNTVEKTETRSKEAVYFAFPFAAKQPAFAYQIQNGWVRPNEDQLPGACREWFTPQNLVHLRDGSSDVAWATPDAPLVCLTDINRGKWLTELPITNGHVYSYVMHNYWFTNYRARQGGQFQFRYSITSGPTLSREQLARFDAETRAPVLAYPFVSSFSARVGTAGDRRPLPAASGSFLGLADANLQLVMVKEAEDLEGFIVRFREVGGRDGETQLRLPNTTIEEAFLCNGVEVNQKKLESTAQSVKVPYQANQYVTVRIRAKGALQVLAQK